MCIVVLGSVAHIPPLKNILNSQKSLTWPENKDENVHIYAREREIERTRERERARERESERDVIKEFCEKKNNIAICAKMVI